MTSSESGVRGGVGRGDDGAFVEKHSGDAFLRVVMEAHPEPLSASEVGERVEAPRTTAANRLGKLVEDEDAPVETKKVGARARVYWSRCEPTSGE